MFKLNKLTNIHEFKLLEDSWQKLITQSDANPLFLGWPWQYSWWESWGIELGIKLEIICVYQAQELVGILPLFRESIQPRLGIKRTRLQFIGNHWQTTPTVRTEYLGPIIKSNKQKQLIQYLVDYLVNDRTWDEFILCDIDVTNTSSAQYFLNKLYEDKAIYSNILEENTGVAVDTTKDFKDYISKLGKSTRKKYFNDIAKSNRLNIKESSFHDDIKQFNAQLNGFHAERWGQAVFNNQSLKFHCKLVERINNKYGQVLLDSLIDADQVISVIYNIQIGDSIFNIQSGYIESFKSNLALGKVHMGMSIKNAFEVKLINKFDLLAGNGKNSNYKSFLGGKTIDYKTLAIIQSKPVLFNYKLITFLKKLRDTLSNALIKK